MVKFAQDPLAAALKEVNVAPIVRRVRTIRKLFTDLVLGDAMASKGQKKADGGFDLSQAPSHLLRRCVQYANDLFSQEPGASDLTKQQYTVLSAVEQNEGMSQTDLVNITGIDRSTLAEMIRRMIEKGLLDRERTESDQRANAVRIARRRTQGVAQRAHCKRARGKNAARRSLVGGPLEIRSHADDCGFPSGNQRAERRKRPPQAAARPLIRTLFRP